MTRLENFSRLRMIVTQRTHMTTNMRCDSTLIVVCKGTIGITHAARCMCTKARTVLYARSGFFHVRPMRQLFHRCHFLQFLVLLLALCNYLSIKAIVTEQLFRL